MDWRPHAAGLSDRVTHPHSRWRQAIAAVPRHLLVPRWWVGDADGWALRSGSADEVAWMRAAYSDRTLVTQIGPLHADHAPPGGRTKGYPTSSSTLPSLVVQMLRHLRVYDGADVLDVGTGSGYGTGVLAHRLGDDHVTSIDVDPYLTKAAAERLDGIGLRPRIRAGDATGPLPGEYDRIVSMVSVRPIPASWLAALRPGGRLVTVLTNTSMIITADKTADGGAVGQVERDWAMFMPTRAGVDYPPRLHVLFAAVRDREGDGVSHSPYPVPDVIEAWELRSMLELTAANIEHRYEESGGRRTAWMLHDDGSWARASAVGNEASIVHQGGPRRLWDLLDEVRHYWLAHGSFPLHGAKVSIAPDGTCHLRRGRWQATVD